MDSSNVRDILEALFLPKLKYDLDSAPIDKELFVDYQANVECNLPLLFDIVQQQKQVIYENKELHSSLILLLCELAPETIFRISNERLLQNVHRLLDEQTAIKSDVESLIFEYYRDKLKQDVWKRNMGAVHGFAHYLEHFYNRENNTKRNLEGKWLNFSLAIALNIRDCHENTYKQLGIKIFLIIMQHTRPEEICELNVHSVIYDSTLKDVHFMDDTAAVKNTWNCVLMCLDFFENIDSLNWCQVDDLLEILVRNIPLTNNSAMSVCLLSYVIKLCTYFTMQRAAIFQSIETAFVDSTKLEDCRNACVSNTSYTIFRWAKAILEAIIFECYKLMQSADTCFELLRTMHKCYLAAILPIPASIAEPHLISFYEKFTAVLMECLAKYKDHESVIKETENILLTFVWQLKRTNCDVKSSRLSYYQEALEGLCRHNVFINKSETEGECKT